jgi:hypothetical protein
MLGKIMLYSLYVIIILKQLSDEEYGVICYATVLLKAGSETV